MKKYNPHGPRVEHYDLKFRSGGSGRTGHQKKATRVHYPDGHTVSFTEKMSHKEAIRQADYQRGKNK